ncbi:MAG TPA: hypothetical protein VFQ86_02675 [Arachidicoccus soli]|nr:hypothetical protein [Arachidicoccus soli]
MDKKKGNESLSEALISIENKLEILKKDCPVSDIEIISEMEGKIILAKKALNGLKVILLYFLIILLISIGIAVGFAIYSNNLEKSNTQIQTTIQKVYEEKSKIDPVIDTILGIKYDSLGNAKYYWRIKNGKIVTYEDLVSQRDSFDIYKGMIEHVKDNYPLSIGYKIKYVDKGYMIVYEVNSPIIDSALMLLPFYRDKISKKDYKWYVDTSK